MRNIWLLLLAAGVCTPSASGGPNRIDFQGTAHGSSFRSVSVEDTFTGSGDQATISTPDPSAGFIDIVDSWAAGSTTNSHPSGSPDGSFWGSILALTSTELLWSIFTASLAMGIAGAPYSQTLLAASGTPPYFWTVVSGRLPVGLTLDSATGQISGTPTELSLGIVTFQVTDSSVPAQTATAAFVLSVVPNTLAITTAALPNGQVGMPYLEALQTIGGTRPLTWSLNPGYSLPPGLRLDPGTGEISGTPTTAVRNNRLLVRVRVTDATVPVAQTADAVFLLTITN